MPLSRLVFLVLVAGRRGGVGGVWGGCGGMEGERGDGGIWWEGRGRFTVFIPEDEDEDGLEAEEVEEIPGEGGDPADVEVAGHDAGLEHGFEAEG